jgi:hypothetical protein
VPGGGRGPELLPAPPASPEDEPLVSSVAPDPTALVEPPALPVVADAPLLFTEPPDAALPELSPPPTDPGDAAASAAFTSPVEDA